MEQKRILILTASIGSGHDEVAKTIGHKLLEKDQQIQIKIIDFMQILHPSISKLIISSYLKMIGLFPSWYHYLYQWTMKINSNNKVKDIISYRYQKKLLQVLDEFKPCLIVFTNPFPLSIAISLKKKGMLKAKTATIITDYTAHSVWMDGLVDYYFVGSHQLKKDLIREGIHEDRIIITGIPVHYKFMQKVDQIQIANQYQIELTIPTLLIMGGGLGLGPIEEVINIIQEVNMPLQILVVTGRNEELKKILTEKIYNKKHLIKIFGYVDNVNELMDVSDLLISKAGGLTMTEAMNKELPVLIVNPIPGQEEVNASFFSKIGTAIWLQQLQDIKLVIQELLYNNPLKLKEMKDKCKEYKRPRAVEIICKVIYAEL